MPFTSAAASTEAQEVTTGPARDFRPELFILYCIKEMIFNSLKPVKHYFPSFLGSSLEIQLQLGPFTVECVQERKKEKVLSN